jgi:hypothetical protein
MQRIDTIFKFQVYNNDSWRLYSIDFEPKENKLIVYILLLDINANVLYYKIDEEGGYTYGTF